MRVWSLNGDAFINHKKKNLLVSNEYVFQTSTRRRYNTELRVIAPLDISGFTRPRVLLDVTEALRQLQVMVFKADIITDGRSAANLGATRQEVHRFLLTDERGQPISSVKAMSPNHVLVFLFSRSTIRPD